MIVFSSYISQWQIGHFMDIQSKKKTLNTPGINYATI